MLRERATQRQGTVTLPEFTLESGESLASVTVAYEAWGHLNATGTNAILLCHALTGSAHARDDDSPDDPRTGWWNPLIGPGRVFDTDQFCVICSNVLGGCYGTTGPTSPHPDDSRPYRTRFPLVSVNDMVRAQRALIADLGVESLVAVVGGSLGGLQSMEWALLYPEMVNRAIIIGAAPRLSTQGLAIDDIARQAIMADPAWNSGVYEEGAGPTTGLGIARMLAMLTYSTAQGLQNRFERHTSTFESTWPAFGARFDVETYMQHQADKLIERFDANAYLYLTSAMDRYDAAAGRGDDAQTWARLHAETLLIGISSDWLYPAAQVRATAEAMRLAGVKARYAEISSANGHDAFFQEWSQLDAIMRPFLSTVVTNDAPSPTASQP